MTTTPQEPKVAVIIPFFQREKGLLRKAVLSVLAQKGFGNFSIIVIDDGSPVKARDDIADLLQSDGDRICLIEQKNAGPGAARNRGLDAVGADTEYVAFLDSDDTWMESHLENAVCALERGYDFYFSDFLGYDGQKTIGKRIDPAVHAVIDRDRRLYEYHGDIFDGLARAKDVIISTRTVVYRYKKFATLRFQDDLFIGEDGIFWMDLSLLTRRFVFSMQVEADCGRGINVWEKSAGWDSIDHLQTICAVIRARKRILQRYCLDAGQRSAMRRRLNQYRCAFAEAFLHDIRRNGWKELATLFNQIRSDWMSGVCFLPTILRIIYAKGRD